MNEQPILFEYKVWGTISAYKYRQKQNYRVIGLLLFILLGVLLFYFRINSWILSIGIAVTGPFIIVFGQRRQTTLQLSADAITIFNPKIKTTIKLEEAGTFCFYTYDEEHILSYTLVPVAHPDKPEIDLNNMPVLKIRKLLTVIHHMGYSIYLPHEKLHVQDSQYYITPKSKTI